MIAFFSTLVAQEAITSMVPILLIGEDQNGTIIDATKPAELLFGCVRRGGLNDMSVEELLPETLRTKHKEHRLLYNANPEVRQMGAGLNLYGRRLDGVKFPLEVGLFPIRWQQRNCILVFLSNMTERIKPLDT